MRVEVSFFLVNLYRVSIPRIILRFVEKSDKKSFSAFTFKMEGW